MSTTNMVNSSPIVRVNCENRKILVNGLLSCYFEENVFLGDHELEDGMQSFSLLINDFSFLLIQHSLNYILHTLSMVLKTRKTIVHRAKLTLGKLSRNQPQNIKV